MDPTITATIIGVLLTAAFGAFATAFAWLRSDTNVRLDKVDARFDRMDEKVDARFDKMDEKVDARFDKMDEKVDARFDKMDARFERLETTVQALIVALARRGYSADPDDSGAGD